MIFLKNVLAYFSTPYYIYNLMSLFVVQKNPINMTNSMDISSSLLIILKIHDESDKKLRELISFVTFVKKLIKLAQIFLHFHGY